MDNGRYSALLPYDDWVAFNLAQRRHYNMVETSGPVLANLIISGLFQPRVAALAGLVYGLSRILYAVNYNTKYGPKGRTLGAIGGSLSLLVLFGLSFYSGLKSVKLV
jgi:MAPEG family